LCENETKTYIVGCEPFTSGSEAQNLALAIPVFTGPRYCQSSRSADCSGETGWRPL